MAVSLAAALAGAVFLAAALAGAVFLAAALAGAVFLAAALAGAVFFAAALAGAVFFAAALAGAAFLAGAALVAFVVVPEEVPEPVDFVGVRRIALRAADTALPASDFLVVRAMGASLVPDDAWRPPPCRRKASPPACPLQAAAHPSRDGRRPGLTPAGETGPTE